MNKLLETWADDYAGPSPSGFFAKNLGVSGQRGQWAPDWNRSLDLRTVTYEVLLREMRPVFSAVLTKLSELAMRETGAPLTDETVAQAMEILLREYFGIDTAKKVLAHLSQTISGVAQ